MFLIEKKTMISQEYPSYLRLNTKLIWTLLARGVQGPTEKRRRCMLINNNNDKSDGLVDAPKLNSRCSKVE